MSTRRLARGTILALAIALALAVPAAVAQAQGITRYVNPTDPTCGGHAPCYTTIQAAVNAVLHSDTIQLQAGTYHEQVSITGKNSASTSESDRIVIQADPAAVVGSVVLQGSVTQCTNGHAVRFQQARFITLRGLTITGAGGQAISMLGGTNQNQAIHLERLRIFGNGSSECNGGITINSGNPDTLVLNSLIYGNGRNGVATLDSTGGPLYLIGNTIHGNAWSGVNVTRSHVAWLVNNAITGNGTATGSTGGRFGVVRESTTSPDPVGIHLLNNLVCGNRLGEINGPALDGTDAGNLTPTGSEGPGVTANSTCAVTADVYAHVAGTDNLLNTVDDDFTPVTASPLLDSGFDPRTLGLSTSFNPLLESDYLKPAARPRLGTPGGTARFDIGAREPDLGDEIAPLVTFLQPAANAYVRGTVTVQAQANDAGSGVASLVLTLDGQAFSTTLSPTLPPPAPSVTATTSWNTTTVPDGAHNFVATAADASGNPGSAPLVVLVDNTAPETQIDTGPSGEILVAGATFTFSGSDNLTPVGNLVFSYRLDGGAWSAFASDTTVTFPTLTEASHTFEVKARDLAGNEDPTPATRTFSVSFRPSITTVNPSSGPIGTYVTITGTNLEPGTTTVTFNGLTAVIRTITTTQITTTVPVGAATGPLTVTNSHGSTSATFTVTQTGDFTLTAAPAPPATARVIAGDQTSVSVAAGGTGSFTSLVSLTLSSAPSGVTASFSPSNLVAPGANVFATIATTTAVAAGTYNFTVTGQADVDGRSVTRVASFTLEVLAAGTPAVTGRVLTAEAIPRPIPGVTVTLGSAFVLTDAAGNFVLLAPPTGPNMLFVDGRTASTAQAQFPIVEVNVNVSASGPSRVPFNIYLPMLDTAHPINLPLDAGGFTTQQVLATTPTIPGLVVTIPQGTRIIGPDGNPVSQLIITPVPIDRSPMPFPAGVTPPMLFAINPGGAVPSQPLPISFPNVQNAPPGSKADLYFFDLSIGTWNIWGTGTVSQDGTQIVSDPGFGLPRLAWHYPFCQQSLSDEVRSRQANRATGGEPVDLPTGRFTIQKTDLVLPGRLPLAIKRYYRSENPQPGLLGIGWTLDDYDTTLTTRGTSMALIFPDQSTSVFAPAGTGQWTNSADPFLRGAILTQLAGDFQFQLRFKDGTIHRFGRISGFANLAGLTQITDRNSNTVTLTRGTSLLDRRILQITEPGGRALTLAYDPSNRLTSVTDPIGRQVQYSYDAQGHLVTVTDPAGGVTRYTYDNNHRILTITDPKNITFLTNTYDTNGRVIRQTQADGGALQFAYVLNGTQVTQTTVTDPQGNPTTYRFDSRGYTLSTTDALGQTTTLEYAPGTSLLTATTDPLGLTAHFTYDSQGNLTSAVDPAGNQTTFTYDLTSGAITSVTGPMGNTVQFQRDPRGNVTGVVDGGGVRTAIVNDALGQPIGVTHPMGNTMTYSYDAVGNPTTIIDPLGSTTRFSYDAVSRVISRSDARGRTTQFSYDGLNRLVARADPAGGNTTITYDGNGNVVTITDPRGQMTTVTHDSMDRLLTRTYPLGGVERYAYDSAGNLSQYTDRNGRTVVHTYDALRRRVTTMYGDSTATHLTYDAGGRMVAIEDSVGGIIRYSYDVLGRVLSQTGVFGTVSYAYDALDRRTLLSTPGAMPISYAYDINSRPTSVQQGSQTVGLQYDANGRRTSLSLPNSVLTSYQYDAASRLTGLTYQNGAGLLGTLIYAFDPVGELTRLGGTLATSSLPGAISNATHDAENRQLLFGDTSIAYDAEGNPTTMTSPAGVTTLQWDGRNRLVGLTGPVSASFLYDAVGRRIAKTINNVTTRFLYDGPDIAQEVVNGVATAYLRLPFVDAPVARGSSYYLTDHLGSILGLTDASGAITTRYLYGPFGDATSQGAVSDNPLQFTGRENDGTGLLYYRARYYAPAIHRFLGVDLLPGVGANRYAYAGNNPVGAIDPFGLETIFINGGSPSFGPGGSLAEGDGKNTGLRDLEQRLKDSGEDVVGFYNSGQTEAAYKQACDLKKNGRPVFLIGHSLGGRAALAVARQLAEKCGVAPDHVFTIDPFEAPDVKAPPGAPTTNFYQRRSWWFQGPEVEGAVANIFVPGAFHIDITETEVVQGTIERTITESRGMGQTTGGRY
jgi:RHS repeat-associated protein